jgi:MFS transporter, PAT family, beta-lactamase induction signal transducer AmpG
MRSFSAGGLKVYLQPRVAAMLFLGFSSGLPLALTGATLQVWMKDAGVSLSAIGLYSLVGIPYVLKFLWAPLVDAVSIPYLTARLGRRRGWMAASQLGLMIAVTAMGQADPLRAPLVLAGLALLVAFLSATQDIVIDAFRVESLSAEDQAAGMANFVAAYRVALLVSTAGAIEMYALLGGVGLHGAAGWAVNYTLLAMLLLIGVVTVLLCREPDAPSLPESAGSRLWQSVIRPFTDFSARQGWVGVLVFVLLFKLGDAAAGVMTAPFVLDLGFEMTTYGRVVKGIGLIAVLAGGFVGGMAARGFGLTAALWAGGVAQMASNLMFVWLALAGADLNLLIACIGVENFTGGFGTVAFVAYLGALCRDRAYTATQFALLTSLAAVGRTVLSSVTGYVVMETGWAGFFLISTLAAFPGLVMLWWMNRPRMEMAV